MKRLVVLTDEQIELILAWGDLTRSATECVTPLPNELILHDFEDDDQEAYGVLAAARLAS